MAVSELDENTAELLDRAARGDSSATDKLLTCNRDRLVRMVEVRMDARMASRVDPSDVVQETMTVAAARLPVYLVERPIPFYPWLRQIAWQKLVDLHRQHVGAKRRSVVHEASIGLPAESSVQLVDYLLADATSPSMQLARREIRQRVRRALAELPDRDREVLALLYLEQLTTNEVSAVLDISEKAVSMRHLRALDRLRPLLK